MKTVLLENQDPLGEFDWLVWQMIRGVDTDVTYQNCLGAFERIPLAEATEQRAVKLPSLYRGRTIVVFGDELLRALYLPKMLIHPIERNGVVWRQLPHLSETHTWFKDMNAKNIVASLLYDLYLKGQQRGQ